MSKQSNNLKKLFKIKFKNLKIPSLMIYQKRARIYLDEYEGQKELHKEWIAKKWNLNNENLKWIS